MNYLAHLLLAAPEEHWRLGALLGDHVKGRAAVAAWPEKVALGITHHRALDYWTDTHPLMRAAREHAPPELRRYMGIVLDVMLDGWLCRHWRDYSAHTLDAFTADAYALLRRHEQHLPPDLRRFTHYAEDLQLFSRYHEPPVMDRVFHGIAQRLSRPGPLAQARPLLVPVQAQLDACFAGFFPQAQQWSAQWIAAQRSGARKSTISGS